MLARDLTHAAIVALAASLTACGAPGQSLPASSSSARIESTLVQAPAARYAITSSAFTGNTPFHHSVGELQAAGATTLPPLLARNYWSEGIQNYLPASQTGGTGPLYTVRAGDPGYRFSCPTYGTCNANGLLVHFPSGAVAQTGIDHHLTSFDPVYIDGETDGWGGDGNGRHACNLNSGKPGTATCSWGGFFPFSGDGIAHGDSSGQAGGYALGIMQITAQELLQGHIDHAIGIEESCLDNGGVYPAIVGRSTDAKCPAGEEPNVRYGHMIHLKSSVNVATLGYSPYCRVVVTALQKYGAYTANNNGGWGIALTFEYPGLYPAGSNPWFDTIFPSMVAGADGSGSGAKFVFGSCLNRIPANDIEVIQISPKLPKP